jgi:penicillin-binding protein 2
VLCLQCPRQKAIRLSDFRQQLKPRFAILGFVVLAVLGLLLARLWTLQVLNGSAYAEQAKENRVREVTTEAPRGRILDRTGLELVTNRPTMAVVVEPSAKNDEKLLARLSTVLNMPVADIKERASSVRQAPLAMRTVAIDVPMAAVSYISEHESEFPGVEVRTQAVRKYPQGVLAAHVLGYAGEVSQSELEATDSPYQYGDTVGKAGAEKSFEKVLQGDRGRQLIEVDARGRPRKVILDSDPVSGRDVVLTIDSKVQVVTEKALAQAMEDAHKAKFPKARAGAAVAIDIKTGEIIAMASLPTYDPELFLGGISQKNWKTLTSKDSEFPLTNRAIMAQYPAASTPGSHRPIRPTTAKASGSAWGSSGRSGAGTTRGTAPRRSWRESRTPATPCSTRSAIASTRTRTRSFRSSLAGSVLARRVASISPERL